MDAALHLQNVTFSAKRHFWSKRTQILKGVDFDVPMGSITGLVGPNGAGKTTVIKAVLGLLRAQGTIELLGKSPHHPASRQGVAFMPERTYFPEELTARELLTAHGQMLGLRGEALKNEVNDLLSRVGLNDAADRRMRHYSKGMLQRAGVGQALLRQPKFVILDEPMSGLDPLGRVEVRNLILAVKQRGGTVLFSTHILPDVEAICDHVVLMREGRVGRSGSVAELSQQTNVDYEIVVRADVNRESLQAISSRLERRGDSWSLVIRGEAQANEALALARQQGLTVTSFGPLYRGLESLILEEQA